MISVILPKQGKTHQDYIRSILLLQCSDKDDDSTADEEDLLHSRVKRRTGRSPNSSQIPLNADVRVIDIDQRSSIAICRLCVLFET